MAEGKEKKEKKALNWGFIDFTKLAAAKLKSKGLRIVKGRDRNALFIIFSDDSLMSIRISQSGEVLWGSTTIKEFQQAESTADAEAIEIV